MNIEKVLAEYNRASEIGNKIWSIAAAYAKEDNITTRTSELIPALNAMIDVTTTRMAAGEATIPDSIMYFLFILCLCSSFLLGYDRKNKFDWIVVIGFALMLSATVFTIIVSTGHAADLSTWIAPIRKLLNYGKCLSRLGVLHLSKKLS